MSVFLSIQTPLWNHRKWEILMKWLVAWLFLCPYLSTGQELPQNCPNLGHVYQQVFCGNPRSPSDCTLEVWLCDGRRDCSTGLDESPATCLGDNPCRNITCWNGGTCYGVPYQVHKTVAYHMCVCQEGFSGRYCDQSSSTISITGADLLSPADSDEIVTLESSHSVPTDQPTTILEEVTQILPEKITEDTLLTWQPPADTTELEATSLHEIKKRANGPTLEPSTEVQLEPRATLIPDVSQCFPNPCYHGVCTPLWQGFQCSCRPGFTGTICQMSINPCASEPCINGGVCTVSAQGESSYVCSCQPGFSSRQCEAAIDECSSQPCQNGGTCVDHVAAFSCQCRPGYTATRCEVDINECGSSPCYLLEGGTCMDDIDQFRCQCPGSRAGMLCERQQLCQQDPCLNYGVCFPSSIPGQAQTCQCLPGFAGPFCEVNINECVGNTCLNGICIDGILSYTCQCNEGYTGRDCDKRIDPCQPNPCQNNGYCCRSGKSWCAALVPIWYFECYCTNGYTGSLCERLPDPCTPDPCSNGGLCNHVGSGYVCTCPVNYAGTHCETPAPCASQPCFNSGQCGDLGEGLFQCTCDEEHFGTYCESVIPCLGEPCLNGGLCVSRDSGYDCQCPDMYGGLNCEIYLPCAGSPCRNNGLCFPAANGQFQCSCPGSFTGTFCERFVQCSSQPCQNGGNCVEQTAGLYRCECPLPFAGQNCEFIQSCATNPCGVGGQCTPIGNSFVCVCNPGFTGLNCDTFLACSSSPCANNAVCENTGNSFTCRCLPSYTGTRCEVYVPCTTTPCLNSGACVPDGTSFRCACTPAYTGPRCQFFRSCTSQPCLNQGLCTDLENEQFRCDCPPMFTGHICETSMLCFPNPCLNSGQCSIQNGQIVCSCVPPFMGPRCEMRDNCVNQPCENGGYCVNLETGSRCLCTSSFTGVNCETYLHCSSSPCLNNGVCTEDGSTYLCTCTQIYGGRNCENFIPCGSFPCLNGAQCINRGGVYECRCQPHYAGLNCEVATQCASSPCLAGICNNVGESYVCECDARYTGRNCDSPLICDVATCVNGNCQVIAGVGTCVCHAGYTGAVCDVPITQCRQPCLSPCQCVEHSVGLLQCQCPPTQPTPTPQTTPLIVSCDSAPCFNGGQCIHLDSGIFCQCTPPYEGARCEKRAGVCDSRPCFNQGRCIDDGSSFRCICQPPWTGEVCEVEIRLCSEAPCTNGGTCHTDSLGVFCVCLPQVGGLFCQLLDGLCDPNPCFNGGDCWQVDGAPVCNCPRGTEGPRCENRVVGCIPNPCNEGNCVENSQGSFQCTCPPDWIGAQCQIRNPCFSQPCNNGGTCVANEGDFTCQCLSGFAGPLCDGSLPKCASAPCFNGGTCSESSTVTTGFICSCLPGFTSTQCEINIDDCAGIIKCFNGGTCHDLVNSFRCECEAGFSGTQCTVRDTCTTEPCGLQGTCQSVPNPEFNLDYTCLCLPEYEGPNCKQFRYCSSSPCRNGGVCANLPTGFSCTCQPGYTGPTCEQQILGCNGVTCNGRGTCMPTGLFGYRCNCTEGFVGQDCESSSCGLQPCLNNGVCKVSETHGFLCQCPPGLVGDKCQTASEAIWPELSGSSYLSVPLVPGLSDRTAIEVTFKPTQGNGLLLFASHSDTENGDFMALGLEQQVPVFRINLGSGVLPLRGEVLPLDMWHTVQIKRVQRSTEMKIGDYIVQGQAPGGSVGLTLESPIYVGGVSNFSDVNPRIGFTTGFQGCIHDVKVGQSQAAVLPWRSSVESQDVRSCTSDPCTSHNCANGGQCIMESGTGFSCLCPVGFGGTACTSVVATPTIPGFTGTSYLHLTSLPLTGQDLTMRLDFRPTALDGILLYTAEDNDFFSLFLSDGNLHFAFDLGSGSVTLTSLSKVTLSAWQTVDVVRSGFRAQMVLGGDRPVVGNALGSNLGMDVGNRMYVGAVPRTVSVRTEVLANVGFSGCIKDLTLQNAPIDLKLVTEGFGVGTCTVPACDGNQCTSGSTCRASTTTSRGYECVCPPGKTGIFCEANMCTSGTECRNNGQCVRNSQGDSQCLCTYQWTGPTCSTVLRFSVASFASNGYLAYSNEDFIGFQFTEVEIVFRTALPNGLLVWMGKADEEFLALVVRNGILEARTNLGGGSADVITREVVDNNEWTTARLVLSGIFISLEVTNQVGHTNSYYGRAPGSDNQLTVGTSPLYIGGLPGGVSLGTGGMFQEGLGGCVIQLRAARLPQQYTDIRLQDQAVDGAGVAVCEIS